MLWFKLYITTMCLHWGQTISVAIHRSGTTPTGPYILFSALQAYVASSLYTGNLTFTLSTKNAYNTTKLTTRSVSVNLQKPQQPYRPNTERFLYYWWSAILCYKPQRYYIHLGACTDPNGTTPIYYDVETNTDGTWIRVATGLTSTTYTTSTMGRTTKGTLQFRVKSRTTYNTESPWVTSDQIVIHYYYPPTISGLSVDRTDTTKTSTGTIKKYTSIDSLSYNLTIQFKNGITVLATQTPTMTDTYNFSYTKTGMSESETYTETVTVSDTISTGTFNLSSPQSTSSLVIPRYAAMLTIREKGVGVNAVADNFASWVTKGTSTMYGGDIEGIADGTLNFSVGGTIGTTGINYYLGAYVDSIGKIRAAYTSPQYTIYAFMQVQVYFNSTAPMRYRYFYPSSGASIPKDAAITDYSSISYGGWSDFVTAGNLSTLINNLGYLRDGYTNNGLWKRRDLGSYYTTSNPTGILCIPIGTTLSLTEYAFGEVSMSWNLSANSCPKFWYTMYTTGSTPSLNGSYLTSISDATLRFGWSGTQRLICIGQTTTTWTGLRTINHDLITSNTSSGKPAANTFMNPYFTTTNPTFYGTASALLRA